MINKSYIIPKRPQVVIKPKKEDARRFCIIPIRACLDKSLSLGDFRMLAILASYSSPNGYSYVAQSTLASYRGVSSQMISKSIKRLVEKGYVEIVRAGYKGMRGALRRIIFDANINAVDAISISNCNEVHNEGYQMKRTNNQPVKQTKQPYKVEHSAISYDEALLVVSQSLKSDSDLLRLEQLVSRGVSRAELLEAFKGVSS
jgi:biotin operon repressor